MLSWYLQWLNTSCSASRQTQGVELQIEVLLLPKERRCCVVWSSGRGAMHGAGATQR